MAFSISFKEYCGGNHVTDPVLDKIREAATKERWAGIPGFKEWAKTTYNATLRSGRYGTLTSISFKTEQDMIAFKQALNIE